MTVAFSFRLIDFICEADIIYFAICVSLVLDALCMLNIEGIECFGLTMCCYSSYCWIINTGEGRGNLGAGEGRSLQLLESYCYTTVNSRNFFMEMLQLQQ